MAMTLGKIGLVIGAGLVGSALSKEGRISDVTGFFSGALKIVTKHLQQDKNKSTSTSKPQTDSASLLAQVNNLRQELQFLASSRSVTIVTGSRSGSRTYSVAIIVVVGVVGYGYIRWKGWKLFDMMFVTRRGFSDACNSVGKQVDGVKSSVTDTKRHLCSKIDRVDSKLEECNALTTATKDEVSGLQGIVGEIQEKVENVVQTVRYLESGLFQIESNQDAQNDGVLELCKIVHDLKQQKSAEFIQSSSSRQAIEHQSIAAFSRTISLPPLLALEESSPSAFTVSPKVVRSCCPVSPSILKDMKEAKAWNPRVSVGLSNVIPTVEEPSSSASSSRQFRSKLNASSIFSRARD